ncbi:type II toxin-antitoxin system Phd/YefM family antitoxin [Streptomyces sp. NPDC014676]|uniref:type II toxin-antitoxin system Phd/YefM family antitoxin n=1 Tax=Streptomyces sp. NPDC014676 TaxID=3364879 RepID=UPI0037033915
MSITASEARARLFPLIQQVNDDHEPVEITSRGGNAVLMSADGFRSWQETVHLLRSPANAAHLRAAADADKAADAPMITRSMAELEALAEDGE